MNWLLRRKFLVLLLSLILLLVIFPVLHGAFEGRLLLDVLVTIVFLAALVAVFTQGYLRGLALLLGIPTMVGIWTGYVLPDALGLPLSLGFHVLAALFLGFTVAVILRTCFQEARVSADSVCGAFCGYLLVGVAFGHLYCVIETVVPGSFLGKEAVVMPLQPQGRLHFLFTYFSFATLTTVGFGDITPAREMARAFAVVEAVMGQFYIAVLIAALIGKRVSQASSDPSQ
jgi:hypothetical protein